MLASVQAACGGVAHETPRHGSVHAPSVQVVGQVLSTGSYLHWPVTQRPPQVRAVVPSTQVGAGGMSQVTPVHELSTAVARRHRPSRHW